MEAKETWLERRTPPIAWRCTLPGLKHSGPPLMHGIGWLMVLIYLHLWFAPYKRFKSALDAGEIPVAAAKLNQIRWIVTTNLALGLITAVVGASGRYWG